MSLTARIASILLVLIAALLQVAVVYRLELGPGTPSLVILVVSAIALLTGSVSGAGHGFLSGIALATFAALPLGPHALVGTLVGYAVGRAGEALVTDDHPAPPLVAGAVAALTLQLGVPLLEFLLNPRMGRVDGLIGEAAFVTLVSAVLAVPVYLAVRRLLLAAHAAGPAVGSEATP